jgi:hypothetical protein
MAQRQGYRLVKSRRRDPRAYDYGTYLIISLDTNAVVLGAPIDAKSGYGTAMIDDVEEFLTR